MRTCLRENLPKTKREIGQVLRDAGVAPWECPPRPGGRPEGGAAGKPEGNYLKVQT